MSHKFSLHRPWAICAFLLIALSPCLMAQSQNDLPSAPSAVVQQRQTPPAAAAKPATADPEPANELEAPRNPAPIQPEADPPKTNGTAPLASAGAAANSDQPSSATNPDIPENSPAETIKLKVNEVNLIFTVTDKHGRFVKNLTQKDFEVLDDRKPAEQIRSFRSETNLPLRVGLLIDASNSIRDRFQFEQQAAIEFLNQIIRAKTDQAFVLGFDTTAEVTQDFTNDTEKLGHGVRMLKPGGGTAMYDAIYYACRDKLMKSQQDEAVRRAIILVSDGEDNQSRVTREEAIEMAQRAGVIVYAISTNTSGLVLRGDKIMQHIADATGGRAFFPFKIEDVANAFSEIQEELRSQYALAYKPADFSADGRYRSIDVVAVNHKKLHVRSRKGYYAPSQ